MDKQIKMIFSNQYYVGGNGEINEDEMDMNCIYSNRPVQHVHQQPAHSHSPVHYHMQVTTQGSYFFQKLYFHKNAFFYQTKPKIFRYKSLVFQFFNCLVFFNIKFKET